MVNELIKLEKVYPKQTITNHQFVTNHQMLVVEIRTERQSKNVLIKINYFIENLLHSALFLDTIFGQVFKIQNTYSYPYYYSLFQFFNLKYFLVSGTVSNIRDAYMFISFIYILTTLIIKNIINLPNPIFIRNYITYNLLQYFTDCIIYNP